MNRFVIIIPAAGNSSRMEGTDKLNIMLNGKSVLNTVIDAFKPYGKLIVVGPQGSVPGGSSREESVYNGLKAAEGEADYVLIHDAARPFVSKEIIEAVINELLSGAKAVVPCVRPKDSVRNAEHSLDRNSLYLAQTPQGFEYKAIRAAFDKAFADGFTATDDAGIAEYGGIPVSITEGSYSNIKITTRDDIPKECRLRYGNGYDLHKLVEGRALMLGCVNIPFEKGLLGHSDADVICHAVADAMLGAAALGDIGKHFPDNSSETEGMSGESILKKTVEILNGSGFRCCSVDATLVAQRPKIAPYTDAMREKMASALGLSKDKVSVKATTEEGIGPTGEGIAMAAYATAIVEEK